MSITWSPPAIDRVSEIAEYIAQDKPRAAEKWVDKIFTLVERLDEFPESANGSVTIRIVDQVLNVDHAPAHGMFHHSVSSG